MNICEPKSRHLPLSRTRNIYDDIVEGREKRRGIVLLGLPFNYRLFKSNGHTLDRLEHAWGMDKGWIVGALYSLLSLRTILPRDPWGCPLLLIKYLYVELRALILKTPWASARPRYLHTPSTSVFVSLCIFFFFSPIYAPLSSSPFGFFFLCVRQFWFIYKQSKWIVVWYIFLLFFFSLEER